MDDSTSIKKISLKRVDQYLVDLKKAKSRTYAQELIKAGHVFLKTIHEAVQIIKPSLLLTAEQAENLLVTQLEKKFVSRSGHKLDHAIDELKLLCKDKVVLDIGQSTGGFTDCLLQQQAKLVYGVDVGHDQLDQTLKNHPKVRFFEGINARNLFEFISQNPQIDDRIDMVVMDVSFISIGLIVPQIEKILSKGGLLLSLVKPQFELSPSHLNKKGIVKSSKSYAEVEKKTKSFFAKNQWTIHNYLSSQLPGKDGNHEFFIFVEKK
ncbi:MAG: TlyA family RNA methyltransferase [Pseudobdellovibrionaceae bacterium]